MMGLRSQDVQVQEKFRMEIEERINDPYPPVSVAAAAISFMNWKNEKSQAILVEACRSVNMDMALLSINLLMYMKNKQPFVDTIREVYNMPDRNYNVKAACMDFLGSLNLVPNNYDYRN